MGRGHGRSCEEVVREGVMPPTYTVRAVVVDARTDSPRATDRFFIDTNVWAWEHYPNSRMTPAGLTVPTIERLRPLSLVRFLKSRIFCHSSTLSKWKVILIV